MNQKILHEIITSIKKASFAAYKQKGRKNKKKADAAAVLELRNNLNKIDFSANIFIGEGEKDKAPMLYRGEKVGGASQKPPYDIVVDPLECTTNLAAGKKNSLSVLAIGKRNSFYDIKDYFYMEKLVVKRKARAAIDIRKSVEYNIKNVAKDLNKSIKDVIVCTQDRPRHKKLIEDIKKTGAKILLIDSGDISYALSDKIDMLWGIFGAPEGVLLATGIKAIGGNMQAILKHKEDWVPYQLREKKEKVLNLDNLIKKKGVFLIISGIITGPLLKGIKIRQKNITTYSLIYDPNNRTKIKMKNEV